MLSKIARLNPSGQDWIELYQTLYQYVALVEVIGRQPATLELFSELCEPRGLHSMKIIVEEMMRVINLDETKLKERLVPNDRISRELDNSKLRNVIMLFKPSEPENYSLPSFIVRKHYALMPKIMTEIAREEIYNLPEYVQQCCIVYLPEVGFRLAVIFSGENDDLDLEGYEYQVTLVSLTAVV